MFLPFAILRVEPMVRIHNFTAFIQRSADHNHYALLTDNALGPAFDRPGGALWVYYGQYQLLKLLSRFEQKRRGGVPYERVIYMRVDMHWFYPHPPLKELNPSIGVWVPDGQGNRGINDRHAVCNRTAATVPVYT